MISKVTFERTVYQGPPAKLEAGTGNVAGAVGLGAALDHPSRLGLPVLERYEHELPEYAMAEIRSVPGVHLIGTAPEKASALTFVLDGHRPEDVGSALDKNQSRCGPATTAPSRSCAATGWSRPSGRRWPCTTPTPSSTCWSPRCAGLPLTPSAAGRAHPGAGDRTRSAAPSQRPWWDRRVQLPDQETDLVLHRLRGHLHVVDSGPWRALATPRDHLADSLRGSLEHGFHAARRAVAHPACDIAGQRLSPAAVAVPDVLNSTGDDHTPPFEAHGGEVTRSVRSPPSGHLTAEVWRPGAGANGSG